MSYDNSPYRTPPTYGEDGVQYNRFGIPVNAPPGGGPAGAGAAPIAPPPWEAQAQAAWQAPGPPAAAPPAWGAPAVPAQAGPWGTAPGAQPTWGPPAIARKGAVLVGGTSYECAPWRLRVASSVVDGLVVGVISAMVSLVDDTLGNLAWLLVVLANTVYLQGTTGQTLGKRAVGTHLVRKVRRHPGTEHLVAPGMGTAFLRRIAQTLDSLSLGIGYLAPLWTQRRQTFGDMLTQTVVIKASSPLSVSPAGPSDQSATW